MQYMDVNTASQKWGITGRRVRILCNDGRIDGAVRNGWSWLIPADAPKPGDGRVLRRFRNLDIRPGFVDVDTLHGMSSDFPLSSSSTSFVSLLPSTISFLFLLDGKEIGAEEVKVVLEGKLCSSLSLQEPPVDSKLHFHTEESFPQKGQVERRNLKRDVCPSDAGYPGL